MEAAMEHLAVVVKGTIVKGFKEKEEPASWMGKSHVQYCIHYDALTES